MVDERTPYHPRIVITLLLLGVMARLVPHPPNATPLAAIALFGGTYLSPRWAIGLPLAIVALSDLLIAWHVTVPFTWAAFIVTAMLGWWIRRHPSASRIVGASLGASGFFFLFTNFGVWVMGGLYLPTLADLWQCYVAAIPFVRATVLGDLLYTILLFGSYALATHRMIRQPSRAA